MSATGRPDEAAPEASDAVAQLQEAAFVRIVAAATGDAVAAAALLTNALESRGLAHQCSVVPVPERARRGTDTDLTVALGRPASEADLAFGTDGTPASSAALQVAEAFGAADYELGLAGVVAAGAHPRSDALAAAEEHGIERRPGVATPTTDLADALAHSALVHAPFSGDVDAAETALAAVDAGTDLDTVAEETGRRIASMVAFDVCGEERSTPRAASAVERFLRPLTTPGGQFETVEGYADVLDAIARERPGLALPLALGAADAAEALEAWRTHARRAHETIRSAPTGRYDGLYVVRCDGDAPVGTVARLVADYRSPEPLVLAVDDSSAVSVAVDGTTDHLGERMRAAAASIDGDGDGTATLGRAAFETDPTEFLVAFREER